MPVTVVDSGIDVTHPEFAGRPDTSLLNTQEPAGIGGEHGTSVASLVGAPLNGVGLVGIYPQAVLRSWDAARGQGTRLESSDISAGILAAARAGRGVINLSIGGDRDLPIELAVSEAVATGSLVVAASGNDGDRGSPVGFPAALPHVTTVAATDRSGGVAAFSSRSPYVDIAAPGDGVFVASALGKDWRPSSGTSFSSPLVAGAAAWLWTVRPDLDAGQVAEVLRRSARDIDQPGRDPAAGFGMLNLAAAIAAPTPIRDPFEPNDDVEEVAPNGDRNLLEHRIADDEVQAAGSNRRTRRHVRGSARRLPRLAACRAERDLPGDRYHRRGSLAPSRDGLDRRRPVRRQRPTGPGGGEGPQREARVPKRRRGPLGLPHGAPAGPDARHDVHAHGLRRAHPRRGLADAPLHDDRRVVERPRQLDVGLPDPHASSLERKPGKKRLGERWPRTPPGDG